MFTPIKSNRVFEDIAEQIKDAIYRGRLKPGDKLPSERELVEKFRVSRVSIREAFRSLELAGLLKIKRGAGGGAYIADLDHHPISRSLSTMLRMGKVSLPDITEARALIEPEIARLAATRASAEDIARLRRAIIEQEQALKKGQLPERFKLEFHRILAHAARNPVLTLLLDSFIDLLSEAISDLHPTADVVENVIKYHKRVLAAIEKRRPEQAAEVMSRHIVDLQQRLDASARSARRAVRSRR